jgi:DNA-binding transcriptional LysR family regulator
MLPDLVSLALFVRSVESKSLSKAAEQSHISLSAASRRISLLEDQLDVVLLDRTPKGMEPTPAGEALLFHARILLKEAVRLNVNLSEHAKGLRGVVRLLANTSALTQYLPHQLALFSKASPDIKVEVHEQLSSEIIHAVREGQGHVGVAFLNETMPEDVACYPYKADQLVAVMPKSFDSTSESVRLVDLLDLDLVVLESNTAMVNLLEESAASEGKLLRIRAQVKSFEAICKMIEAGLGIGILPKIAAQAFAHELQLQLIPLSDPWAVRQMYIFVRNGTLPAATKRLVEHLRSESPDLLSKYITVNSVIGDFARQA